ncbi:condensation domain-containing protein [Micromonospora coxensis]|uniref:Condensation domain-containing protein n=1 Tax=Micromonospora coxensis TaxID=356852 RepID=A0A1C5H1N3_9ACTN|nr:condensation domain-containing protein [Micromonospora coxensis]SCG39737.1 Condensation domain-containing protein [Micromonospora coxensis]
METPDRAGAPTPYHAPFVGAAAAPAPLTWGQQALWTAMRRRGAEQTLMSLRRIVATPRRGPADLAGVLRAVGALVGRNSSLRTRIQVVDGDLRQVVAATGELPVAVVDAAADEFAPHRHDPAAVAATLADRLAATPFDHAREWPQRVALVRVDDRISHLVVVFSHVTVDFVAVEALLRQLRLLVLRGAVAAPAGPQSVDVARREQDAARARSARAVAYWVRGYARLPSRTLPWIAPPATPRFPRTVLVSRAADTAVRLAARRCRVTGSTVLLAAVAAVVSRWSGSGVCGLHSMASNRAVAGYADAIAKLNQLGLLVIDSTDRPSFDDLLPRVWQAALQAYRHSYYDPAELGRAFAAAGLPFEAGVSPHCYVNDVRLAADSDPLAPAVDEAQLRATMAATTVVPAESLDRFTWLMRVEITDRPGGIGIALTGDSGHLPRPYAERFLRDIERLLVEAAFRDLPWPWLPSTPDEGRT